MSRLLLLGIILLASCGPQDYTPRDPGTIIITETEPVPGADGQDGKDGVDGRDGKDSEPCTVETTEVGAIITCPDGSTAEIFNGRDGENGADGQDGIDGRDGAVGEDGQDGANGTDGESCSVIQYEDGASILCPDGSQADVTNGQDGQNGNDGKDGSNGLDGKDGEQGPKGDQGDAGQAGADGQDGIDGQDSNVLLVGEYCGRPVLKLGDSYFIVTNSLKELDDSWYRVEKKCYVRVIDDTVESK